MNDLSPIALTVGSVAAVGTPHASRYLQQLCKHFAHRLPVTFDPRSGRIAYSAGDCRLVAGEAVLTLLLMAPEPASLEQLKDVVTMHLLRFAFREEMTIDWHPL